MSDTSLSGRMANAPSARTMWGWVARGEVALAMGVIGIVVLLILPVPAFLLDLFLALSITSAVLILMTSLLIKRPLEFTAFPTVLLVATLYRLGLNIASTRLILGHGHEGVHGAGKIIEAFGKLMMGGSFIIGVIVFAIIVLVNFVVITKGSGRIAEVAARFTLDAMPGKQMAIDADLSAGLIDDTEAKKRRKELEQESTFFGAMDGASKFVKGDAVAGLIIVAINIIGGILIGVIQHKVPLGQAASTYTIMTIGDGLVSQIPALVISIAAGFLVSKSGVEGSADKALVAQLAMNPISLGMVAAAAGVIALIPGMPIIPFAAIAIASGALAWHRSKRSREPAPIEVAPVEMEEQDEPISQTLAIDEIKIELGYGLLGMINDLEGRRLTDQIKALRRTLAADFGFVMPSVRILDNMRLPSQGYCIRIKEMEAGAGEVRLGQLMAMDPRGGQVELPGEHLRWHSIAGALLGLAGTVILFLGKGIAPALEYVAGYSAAFCAAFVWAGYSVLSRRFVGVPTAAVAGFCLATAALAALCHVAFETTVWPATNGEWLAVAALGIGPVGIAFYVWDIGVKRGDIRLLGVASYAAPILSTFFLVLAGFAEASVTLWFSALLIAGGGLLAAKDMLRKKS